MKGNIVQFGNFFHQNSFSKLILSWFRKNQRHLYWRDNRSIYLTYLTEIMLQQTTVKTVENKLKVYLDKLDNVHDQYNITNIIKSIISNKDGKNNKSLTKFMEK